MVIVSFHHFKITMKRFLCVLFFSCFLITNYYSQNKSSVDFTIKNLGINVDGHFNKLSIIAEFNLSSELESMSANISVSSIETGIDSRDEHLLKDEYFNVEKHENIVFKSTQVTKIKANTYKVTGNLTIKGNTKSITIIVNVEKLDTTYKLASNFEINRKDFDVGGSSFVMSKTVNISVVHHQKL